MNEMKGMPEYDITEALNEEVRSGVQNKVPEDLGEHIQELSEEDDAMELLSFTIKQAQENGESEAIITCSNEANPQCLALEMELIKREEHGSIISFLKQPMGGRIGFRILLKKQNQEEVVEDLAA